MPLDASHAPNRFPKAYRLLKRPEFQRTFAARHSVADQCLVIYGVPNELPHSRLGLVVSKKVGNAVVRNRWKRCIREAFRTQTSNLPPGWDFVVLPKRGAHPISASVARSVHQLTKRLAKRRSQGGPRSRRGA